MSHVVTFLCFFLAVLAFAITEQRSGIDKQFQLWCQRKKVSNDSCVDSVLDWCESDAVRMRYSSLCNSDVIGDDVIANGTAEAGHIREIRQIWRWSRGREGQDRGGETQDRGGERQRSGRAYKAEKADVRMMNKVKDGMNGFAQNFIRQGIRALASPIMQALTKAPPAEETYSELSMNDPEQYFQGDVDLTKIQAAEIIRGFLSFINGKRRKRKVGRVPNYDMWNSFPIAYQFAPSMRESSKRKIRQAIKMWEANTCVRFQENGGGSDRLEFTDGSGCSSFVGRAGGTQEITLNQPGCIYLGIIAHEIGHALGFFHEQSRPDQKENVDINFNSIKPSRYNNFVAQKERDVNNYGVPYDFGSLMHYDPRVKSFQAFSFFATDYVIIAKDRNFQNTMGQRKNPSFNDYLQINRAYCANKCQNRSGCKNGGYFDPNNCSRCKCPIGFGGSRCKDVQRSSCGGKISAGSQKSTLKSPGFPGNFPVGSECIWLITSPPGTKIFAEMQTFNFKCKDTCDENFLEIKTGPNFQKTGYRMCCKRPDRIVSHGNQMVVIFSGLASPATRGFALSYWTDARGVIGGKVTEAPTPAPTPRPWSLWTRTEPPRPAPRTTQPPIPSTFAPGATCPCYEWSAWSDCDFDCGGCGFIRRRRRCSTPVPENCLTEEKKHCNFHACGEQSGPTFRGGRFLFLQNGCCVGLVPQDGQCLTIQRTFTSGITRALGRFTGGLFRGGFGDK